MKGEIWYTCVCMHGKYKCLFDQWCLKQRMERRRKNEISIRFWLIKSLMNENTVYWFRLIQRSADVLQNNHVFSKIDFTKFWRIKHFCSVTLDTSIKSYQREGFLLCMSKMMNWWRHMNWVVEHTMHNVLWFFF